MTLDFMIISYQIQQTPPTVEATYSASFQSPPQAQPLTSTFSLRFDTPRLPRPSADTHTWMGLVGVLLKIQLCMAASQRGFQVMQDPTTSSTPINPSSPASLWRHSGADLVGYT